MSPLNFDTLNIQYVNSREDISDFRQALCVLIPDLNDNGAYIVPRGEQSFWDFYRANKETLKKARVYLFKDTRTGNWILKAHPLEKKNREAEELVSEAMKLWRLHLKGCCVSLYEMAISESEMSNGVTQYKLLCPRCNRTRTSAMPYVVVRYLVKEHGMQVRYRPREVSPW